MTMTTEKTLATYAGLRLVQLVPSGERIITDGQADSIGLPQVEVDQILADPSLMALADLTPRGEAP